MKKKNVVVNEIVGFGCLDFFLVVLNELIMVKCVDGFARFVRILKVQWEMVERDHHLNVQPNRVVCRLEDFIFRSMRFLDLMV